MVNAFSLFRTLVIYSVCLPLAIVLGYLLATPDDLFTYLVLTILFMVLIFPLVLRWHYLLLVFCWNGVAGLYFLPGQPSMQLIIIFVSATVSFLNYVLYRDLKFISVPTMTWPLVFLTTVIFGTAKLTGGIGLNVLGADGIGGKRYLFILAGVVGYFALSARRIPLEKAQFYLKLYFGGAATALVGNLVSVVTPSLYFIFLVFPAEIGALAAETPGGSAGIARLAGLSFAAMTIMAFMLARYGLTNIFSTKYFWRGALFIVLIGADMYGGFRSRVIDLSLTLVLMFYLEGLYRSRQMPFVILCFLLGGTVVIPLADKLPMTIQRSLAFLPIKIDAIAEMNAQGSSEWRVQMWHQVIPQIPQYLILGKGYGIDAREMDSMDIAGGRNTESFQVAALAGDYHNGPLSILIPFGIFGALAFLWFLAAGLKVLYRNYTYGDASLILINRYLFVAFIVKIIMFFTVFGSLYSDFVMFAGPIGLSVALNGGMRSRVSVPASRHHYDKRFKLADATF